MTLEIRPLRATDEPAVRVLADRLSMGVAEHRDPGAVLAAVREWVEGSIAGAGPGATVLVADDDGLVVGFVSVSEEAHWSGERDAYIGELVVAEAAEGRGVGRALVGAAEDWGRARGLARIRLATGAANAGALALYDRLGYAVEDVTLSRALGSGPHLARAEP